MTLFRSSSGTATREVMKKLFKYVSLLGIFMAVTGESVDTEVAVQSLPTNAMPQLYRISIELDTTKRRVVRSFWSGNVTIDVDVLSPTNTLTLHASENFTIDKDFTILTKVFNPNEWSMAPSQQEFDKSLEVLTLTFHQTIPPNNYRLHFRINGTGSGWLPKPQEDEKSSGIWILDSYFELTSARESFPCWDDVGFRAPFNIVIKLTPQFILNRVGPAAENIEAPESLVLKTSGKVPITSAFLIPFQVKLHSPPVNLPGHQTVSLDVFKKRKDGKSFIQDVVRALSSYTNISFDLATNELVLMPFQPGTGLRYPDPLTYPDSAVNETSADTDSMQLTITTGLSYELFGNRIMPPSWDDLWLKEAFPFYFQYYTMDLIDPSWHGSEFFVICNNQEHAFPKDTSESLPVKRTPATKEEQNKMNSPLLYYKGSAIIHMLRNVIGDAAFQLGIRNFVTKYSFRSGTTVDLAEEFQKAHDSIHNAEPSYLNVNEIIDSWLTQPGYPVLKVKRHYDTGRTVVKQQSSISNEPFPKWWIPLTYATQSNPDFSSTLPSNWISDQKNSTDFNGVDKDDWIILNVQASGYYRVNYDDENWEKLITYLNGENYINIPAVNRARLIDDLSYLSRTRKSKYEPFFLKLIKYLHQEDEYLPWRSVLSAVKDTLDESPESTSLKHDIFDMMNKFIHKVGYLPRDTEDHFTKLSRTDIIHWACMAGHKGCAKHAAKKIAKFAGSQQYHSLFETLPVDEKGWLFCAGLRGLNDSVIESLPIWDDQYVRDLFRPHVACTKNIKISQKLLGTATSMMNTDKKSTRQLASKSAGQRPARPDGKGAGNKRGANNKRNPKNAGKPAG